MSSGEVEQSKKAEKEAIGFIETITDESISDPTYNLNRTPSQVGLLEVAEKGEGDGEYEENFPDTTRFFKYRWLVYILLCGAPMFAYIFRMSLSMAIIPLSEENNVREEAKLFWKR